MDFEPNEEQRAVTEALEALLARHAGPARAVALDAKGEWDAALARALDEAGYGGAALARDLGFLDAALAVVALARAGAVLPAGAELLVAPALLEEAPEGPVALARAGETAPLRFGAHARTLLVDAGEEARVVSVEQSAREPVRSNFMWPLGRVRLAPGAGRTLGPGSGARLRRWWRLALAAECLGAMEAALAITVEYVKRRRQFGRSIGSFQALQHRLAQCTVLVEATRWLVLEAAWQGPELGDEPAAAAAAYAADAAHHVFRETHQLTGAMGYTRQHDLHVFSMRLEALRLELGGASAHRRALARARWEARPARA